MLRRLFKKPTETEQSAERLYRTLVTQAREVTFYRDFGVPDSVDGRFELVVLHAALTIRRLRGCGEGGEELAQCVFDAMFRDMDTNLREMGAGDIGVARRIKTMAQAFYGRAKAYDDALEFDQGREDDDGRAENGGPREDQLEQSLARNLYGTATPGDWQLRSLARYARHLSRSLEAADQAALMRGEIGFPALPQAAGKSAESG